MFPPALAYMLPPGGTGCTGVLRTPNATSTCPLELTELFSIRRTVPTGPAAVSVRPGLPGLGSLMRPSECWIPSCRNSDTATEGLPDTARHIIDHRHAS